MSENPEVSVRKNETDGQYEILVGEEVAGFATYADANGVRDLPHTVVDPKFRGQGLSKPLIQAALDDARADGMQVTPSCPAVERYIEQNPQYRDLLA
ncbi:MULTISPECIES: GNAT family N-acetyltransferase [Corynebacterium]|uniref:N-acetyltransferase n=1 Tax=Corynebacterium haemomassiliense TaxID=2754726 RepID=A0A7W2EB82_9CORY|nr:MULTISPECIES: GNAT family N-acetyltransferase [Corynebacterium]MBA5244392.1 N-acetyltransferase [Corynebacterium haemomassiliense]MCG7237131.1 N-acetyltransferase [Corynebacterium sp. ACRQP]MDL0401814.1 GNAT family N-acetyltransferase [Corynebacterium lehmanniae]